MSLKTKALDCAIRELKSTHDVKIARSVYVKWEVFHTNYHFKQVVASKKKEFNSTTQIR